MLNYLPPSDLVSVTVGGVNLHAAHRAGVLGITQNGIQGWDDGVEMRREESAIPQAHGSYDTPGFQDSRVITLSGWAEGRNFSELMSLRDQLVGALADGELGRLEIARTNGVQYANVRLAAAPVFRELSDTVAEWTLQYWAPDPRNFGALRPYRLLWAESGEQYQNGVLLHHRGNADAHPVLTIRGSFPRGYRLEGPGSRRFVVTAPLFDSLTHVIDFNTGYLQIDGQIISGVVPRADVWPVKPGQRTLLRFVATGGGQGSCDVDLRDTYI